MNFNRLPPPLIDQPVLRGGTHEAFPNSIVHPARCNGPDRSRGILRRVLPRFIAWHSVHDPDLPREVSAPGVHVLAGSLMLRHQNPVGGLDAVFGCNVRTENAISASTTKPLATAAWNDRLCDSNRCRRRERLRTAGDRHIHVRIRKGRAPIQDRNALFYRFVQSSDSRWFGDHGSVAIPSCLSPVAMRPIVG